MPHAAKLFLVSTGLKRKEDIMIKCKIILKQIKISLFFSFFCELFSFCVNSFFALCTYKKVAFKMWALEVITLHIVIE